MRVANVRTVLLATARVLTVLIVVAETVLIGQTSQVGPPTAVRRVDPAVAQRAALVVVRQVGRVVEHVVVSVVIPARRGSVVRTAVAVPVRMTAVIVLPASRPGVSPSR